MILSVSKPMTWEGKNRPTYDWEQDGMPAWEHELTHDQLVPAIEYCGRVEARSRSGRRHAVAEAKMTGETEKNPWSADVVAKSWLDVQTRYG